MLTHLDNAAQKGFLFNLTAINTINTNNQLIGVPNN